MESQENKQNVESTEKNIAVQLTKEQVEEIEQRFEQQNNVINELRTQLEMSTREDFYKYISFLWKFASEGSTFLSKTFINRCVSELETTFEENFDKNEKYRNQQKQETEQQKE
jgi:flagellin-specific chaperone FliS